LSALQVDRLRLEAIVLQVRHAESVQAADANSGGGTRSSSSSTLRADSSSAWPPPRLALQSVQLDRLRQQAGVFEMWHAEPVPRPAADATAAAANGGNDSCSSSSSSNSSANRSDFSSADVGFNWLLAPPRLDVPPLQRPVLRQSTVVPQVRHIEPRAAHRG
jgi:hypothetical protein